MQSSQVASFEARHHDSSHAYAYWSNVQHVLTKKSGAVPSSFFFFLPFVIASPEAGFRYRRDRWYLTESQGKHPYKIRPQHFSTHIANIQVPTSYFSQYREWRWRSHVVHGNGDRVVSWCHLQHRVTLCTLGSLFLSLLSFSAILSLILLTSPPL